MKRILATVLAILMTLGVFAIGADAGAFDDLTAAEWEAFDKIYDDAKMSVSIKEHGSPWLVAGDFVGGATILGLSALKDPSKYADFMSDYEDAYYDDEATGSALDAYDDFLNDQDALVAAFRAGTLKAQIEAKGNAYINALNAALEPICRTYCKPEFIEFSISYGRMQELSYTTYLSDCDDELSEAIDAIFDSDELEALIAQGSEGRWAEAKAMIDGLNLEAENLLIEAGLIAPIPTPPPSGTDDKIQAFFEGFLPAALANVFTWIVKYLFFGWLWGRWL
jgi:hypothetical protein